MSFISNLLILHSIPLFSQSFIQKMVGCEPDLKSFNRSADSIKKLLDRFEGNDEDIVKNQTQINQEYRKLKAGEFVVNIRPIPLIQL